MPALREAVADSVSARYDVPVAADQVVIVPGGKVTIFFACMVFGGAGTEILYPDPGFPPYREAIKAAAAKPVPYAIREDRNFGFDADEVLSQITAATRLIIVNSPANPTGGVVDETETGQAGARSGSPSPGCYPVGRNLFAPGVRGGRISLAAAVSCIGGQGNPARWLVKDFRHDRMAPGIRHLADATGQCGTWFDYR